MTGDTESWRYLDISGPVSVYSGSAVSSCMVNEWVLWVLSMCLVYSLQCLCNMGVCMCAVCLGMCLCAHVHEHCLLHVWLGGGRAVADEYLTESRKNRAGREIKVI